MAENVDFQCESCGELLRVTRSDQDHWIRCPSCESVQTFPDTHRIETDSSSPSGFPSGSSSPQDSPTGYPSSAGGGRPNYSTVEKWSVQFPDLSIWTCDTRQELEQWIRDGLVTDQCLFQGPSYSQWTPISSLFQSQTKTQSDPMVHDGVSVERPTPVQPNVRMPWESQPQRNQQSSFQSSYYPNSNPLPGQDLPNANSALILVLGILSLASCCIPLGPVGLFIAARDWKEVQQGRLVIRSPGIQIVGVILCVISSTLLFFALVTAVLDM